MGRAFVMALMALLLAAGARAEAAFAKTPIAVLVPGAGGAVPIDFLIRNKQRFAAAGIQTVTASSLRGIVSIARDEEIKGRKIVVVAMSRGTLAAASALASGAKVAGVVFVSGMYSRIKSRLGSPSHLPRTLVVHHRHDACRLTPPSAVGGFVAWAGGRASVRWINTSGTATGRPCGPRDAHAFFMNDRPAVAAIVAFIRAR